GDVVFGVGKHGEEDGAEGHARYGGFGLREEVDNGGHEQHRGDKNQPDGNFLAAQIQVSGNLPFADSGRLIAQDEHRQRHQGKTPDDAKGIQAGQNEDVSSGDDDRENLHTDNEID